MSKKTCILITGDYPYLTSEPFLETEIDFLSQFFEKVYIFALDAPKGSIQTRSTPLNTIAIPVHCFQGRKKYLIYLFRGLLSWYSPIQSDGNNIKRRMVALYEKGRTEYVVSFIREYISRHNINIDNTLVYGYWFSDHALIAARLKQEYQNKNRIINAVCRAHGYDLYWERNTVGYRAYQKVKLELLDGVFPCSDHGSEYLKEKYPQYTGKIHTARLGTVDHGDHSHQVVSEPVLLTCCNLKKLKRISLFAKAFVKIVAFNPTVKWICIGDGEEKEIIEKIIVENGITNNVVFLGRMSNKEVLDYYSNQGVTFFCNVSIFEGLPVSIMEAFSFGIPCIATDVGGSRELVDETNGLLLPRDIDESILADAINEQLSLSNEKYINKRENARRTWENLVSAERNYTTWCEIITRDKI